MSEIPTAFPNVGRLFYNGVEFGAISHVTSDMTFVMDEAQRTVTHHRVTFNVDALVVDDVSTDGQMEVIRQRLGEQGKEFIFTGNGFGDDIHVNGSSNLRDVKWGPKPEVLSWQPIGSLRCCEIKWRITVCIPVCTNAVRTTGIMAFNYAISYSLDMGWTTRTISGYLEIAQTRIGRNVPATADAYREMIAPHVPLGYSRTWNWDLSPDKSRLDFVITDTQQRSPNAFPPHVVRIDANHRVSNRMSEMVTLRNSLSVTVETVASAPPVIAYFIFYNLAMLRIQQARYQGTVLIDSITLDESIYSRQSRFSIEYRILNKTLAEILSATGLWAPTGSSYHEWRSSVAVAHSHRGYSQMRNSPTSDAIVDLCMSIGTQNPSDTEVDPQVGQIPGPPPPEGLYNIAPAADKSYIEFRVLQRVVEKRPVVIHQPLQAPAAVSLTQSLDSSGGPDYGQKDGVDAIHQESGRPEYQVELTGRAIRAGHVIPKPKVTKIGNETPVEVGGEFDQAVIGDLMGVKIHAAHWRIMYALKNSPGPVDLTPIPKPKAAP